MLYSNNNSIFKVQKLVPRECIYTRTHKHSDHTIAKIAQWLEGQTHD